jgi:hypothetical protein
MTREAVVRRSRVLPSERSERGIFWDSPLPLFWNLSYGPEPPAHQSRTSGSRLPNRRCDLPNLKTDMIDGNAGRHRLGDANDLNGADRRVVSDPTTIRSVRRPGSSTEPSQRITRRKWGVRSLGVTRVADASDTAIGMSSR